MSRIERVTLFPVATPFARRFTLGSGDASRGLMGTALFVKIETDDGFVGWGEQRALPTWSYETIETMVAAVRFHLADLAIGLSPFDVATFHQRADAALSPSVSNGMPFARVAIDMAMHDAAGQLAGVPVHDLLGGSLVSELPLCSAIGADTPETMARDALASARLHAYKVKLTGEPKLDAERVAQVAAVTGDKPLWLDANQSYSPTRFRAFERAVREPARIVCVEQPVASPDWAGMATIRRQSAFPIAIDEGCFNGTDLAKIVRMDAADLVVVKICKAGGIRNAVKTAHVARANGVEILASGLTDCGVGFAAALHLFSTLDVALPAELNGPELLAELFVDGLEITDGKAVVPKGPGLGVTVREELLVEHALNLEVRYV